LLPQIIKTQNFLPFQFLPVFLDGILPHIDVEPDLLLVLEAIVESSSQPQIWDPIKDFSVRLSNLPDEDVLELAESINKISRACYYFFHVINPLWARKSQAQEVKQEHINDCEKNFNSNNVNEMNKDKNYV
jgi:hypothetical protein